ncbi:GntR family transcriptional regulator [Rugamonas apoptosis]|uniref:GntR family transcriptional regulator n=1 Tax=Rugamonas apoptosis TaxID=2758570 RepID=A0A7W2IJW1_9BURK|nr:GntR family transcriptional regulator [Rugamonas apoptosis]MBA5686686.1 GntR family transcriptional regulator [Rugamonas apoptosis]
MPTKSNHKPSSGHAILAALRTSITSGSLPPGTVLRQVELAEEFGVSRIPVREALQALQSEGLVVIEPNRGAFVASYSAEQLSEMFDLRVMLEVDALRYAIPQHTERSIRKLEALQRELDDEDQPAEWVRIDRDFHGELYAPSGRTHTLQLIAGLRGSVERFSLAHMGPDTRRTGWSDEHHQLIAAVRGRDVAAASAILTSHLRQTQQSALASLISPSTQA